MNLTKSRSDLAAPVRVLLVDDFEPSLKRLRLLLRKEPGFQIVGEAADGQQAVTLAAELFPHVVILEVALPNLNGLEVTRQLRSEFPELKILFLTGNQFPQVVREAFHVGANGYVIKSDASSELLTAVRAVLQGQRYVSKSLSAGWR